MDTDSNSGSSDIPPNGGHGSEVPSSEKRLFIGGDADGEWLKIPLHRDKIYVPARNGLVAQEYQRVRFVSGQQDFYFFVVSGTRPEAVMQMLLNGYTGQKTSR